MGFIDNLIYRGRGLGNSLDNVSVVKLGGSTLGKHDTAIEDMVELQRRGTSLVIVHGGGKLVTEWLGKQGISTRFIQGQRVTDKATLEVAISVLAGLVNKEIVSAINNRGGQAVGISGVDGALIQSRIKDTELGYVGTVVEVNIAPLKVLLQPGYIPVVAPIALRLSEKPAEAPQMLNVNADTVAGEIAAAIGAQKLIFLTDVAGVCDRSGALLSQLSPDEAEALVGSKVISGGMIPKIRACLRASSHAATSCIIDGRQPHALLNDIEGRIRGTTIKAI